MHSHMDASILSAFEFNALMTCIKNSWVGCNAVYAVPHHIIIISRDSRNVGINPPRHTKNSTNYHFGLGGPH